MPTDVLYQEVVAGVKALPDGRFQGYVEIFTEYLRDSSLYMLPLPLARRNSLLALEDAWKLRNQLAILLTSE